MRFDLPTLSVLSSWFDQNLSDSSIDTVDCSDQALQIHFDAGYWLGLTYCASPRVQLADTARRIRDAHEPRPLSRAEKFLLGARLVEARAGERDRYLWLRLQRPDRQGQPTYGRLYLELIVPRFRAVLVSERRGHALGIWQATTDPRQRQPGSTYEPPSSDRLLPGVDHPDALHAGWHDQETIHRYLIRRLAGGTRALIGTICEAAHLDSSMLAAEVSRQQWQDLWEIALHHYNTAETDAAWSWHESDAQMQVSVVEPPAALQPQRHDSILSALATDPASCDAGDQPLNELRQRLKRQQRRLQHSYEAMQADLDQAATADECERFGSLLLGHAKQIAPGTCVVELPDPSRGPEAVARLELDPQQTPVQAATRMLKQAQKLRRRLKVLPPRMRQMTAQIEEVDDLLERLNQGIELSDREIETVEKSMAGEQGTKVPQAQDERAGARPRRYRTSSGWTVWAGRNNKENDTLSHRLAAQNDYWFHAHGYAGSHVLLRRDGRKEEPDPRTLEEAAGIAAYWSKGRTARKVPVVYTLAKYVSKPRGAAPGLAVMKRERTIMVQPGLLPEDDAA